VSTKLEKANQWLMLVTNIGIVAGFVLIALQLQQSTKAMALQAEAIRDSGFLDCGRRVCVHG